MTCTCVRILKSYAPDELRSHIGVLELVTEARTACRHGVGPSGVPARLSALLPAVCRARGQRGAGAARCRARAGARCAKPRCAGRAVFRRRAVRAVRRSRRRAGSSAPRAWHRRRAPLHRLGAAPLRLDARGARSHRTGLPARRAGPDVGQPARARAHGGRPSGRGHPAVRGAGRAHARDELSGVEPAARLRLPERLGRGGPPAALAEKRQLREFQDGLPFIRAKRDPSPEHVGAWREGFEAHVRKTGWVDVSRLVYAAHLGLVDEAYAAADAARLGPAGTPTTSWAPTAIAPRCCSRPACPSCATTRAFARLCARLGLVEFWLASGKWPDCADEVPYDFRRACEEVRDVPKDDFGF